MSISVSKVKNGWPNTRPTTKSVTAAADLIPPPLLSQLKPGAHGNPDRIPTASLVLFEKTAAGSLSTREILPVDFPSRGPREVRALPDAVTVSSRFDAFVRVYD